MSLLCLSPPEREAQSPTLEASLAGSVGQETVTVQDNYQHVPVQEAPLDPKLVLSPTLKRRGIQNSKVFKPKKIFVSFFNKKVTATHLRRIFSKYGKLRQCYLCNSRQKDQKNQKDSIHRFGFITFYDYEDAKKLADLKRIKHQGIVFQVKAIKYKSQFSTKKKGQSNHNFKKGTLNGLEEEETPDWLPNFAPHHKNPSKETQETNPQSRFRDEQEVFGKNVQQVLEEGKKQGNEQRKDTMKRSGKVKATHGRGQAKMSCGLAEVLNPLLIAEIKVRHEESSTFIQMGRAPFSTRSHHTRRGQFRKIFLRPKNVNLQFDSYLC